MARRVDVACSHSLTRVKSRGGGGIGARVSFGHVPRGDFRGAEHVPLLVGGTLCPSDVDLGLRHHASLRHERSQRSRPPFVVAHTQIIGRWDRFNLKSQRRPLEVHRIK